MGAAPIDDPALLARLRLTDDAFLAHFVELAGHFPPREWTPELFDRGLRYPWYRPSRSYVLRDAETTILHELDPAARTDVLARFAGRTPLLATGSNAAPRTLSIKLAHHDDPEDRTVLVLAGALHGMDVVASAGVTAYGALPATLAESHGTAVRAAVLLVTPAQLTTLTWGELTYALGRLDDVPFVVEAGVDGVTFDVPFAYVSRWGAFLPEGEPAALAAVPATGRRFRAWTQRELLDRAAAIVLGAGQDAEDLTRAVFAAAGDTAARALPALARHARPFAHDGWRPVVSRTGPRPRQTAPVPSRSSLPRCVAQVLGCAAHEVPPPDEGADPVAWTTAWLGRRGLTLVPVPDPPSFGFGGPWLARLADGRFVVRFGAPDSDTIDDPDGGPVSDVVAGWTVVPLDLAAWTAPAVREPTAGRVVEVLVFAEPTGAGTVVEAVRAIPGRGLEGDRYWAGTGSMGGTERPGMQVTLVAAEDLEDLRIPAEVARRNVVTRGVDLDALIGRHFRVGDAVLVGRRRCEPCAHLQRLSGDRPVLRPLVHRGGLRADVVAGGVLRRGDVVEPR